MIQLSIAQLFRTSLGGRICNKANGWDVRNLYCNTTIVCEGAGAKNIRGKQDRPLTMRLFEVTGGD